MKQYRKDSNIFKKPNCKIKQYQEDLKILKNRLKNPNYENWSDKYWEKCINYTLDSHDIPIKLRIIASTLAKGYFEFLLKEKKNKD